VGKWLAMSKENFYDNCCVIDAVTNEHKEVVIETFLHIKRLDPAARLLACEYVLMGDEFSSGAVGCSWQDYDYGLPWLIAADRLGIGQNTAYRQTRKLVKAGIIDVELARDDFRKKRIIFNPLPKLLKG
jgi:hypothetical protein